MFDLFCFLIIKHSNKTIKYLFLIFRGHKDKIFVIKWNPFEHNKLVTVGVKHIKFWTQTGTCNLLEVLTVFIRLLYMCNVSLNL